MHISKSLSLGHAFSSAPWVIPALIGTVVISLLLHRWLARRFRTAPWFVLALMLCVGAILSITITPGNWNPSPYCSLKVAFPRPSDLLALSERSLNIWLFVPLGLTISATPRRRVGLFFFACAMAMPFMIEGFQHFVPDIGRTCQLTDVINNLTGLFLGGFVGLCIRFFWGMMNGERNTLSVGQPSGYLRQKRKI
jgi:VanZ family protein